MMKTLSVMILVTTCPSTADSASYLISGVSDTVQVFSHPSGSADLMWRHLVCWQQVYQTSLVSETCCNQLYQRGAIEKDHIQHCLNHLAVVQPTQPFGSVRPAFYLALNSSTTSNSFHRQQLSLNKKGSYRQQRSLQIMEDKEKESWLDGYKGVDAFSPFHLTGFMPSGLDGDESNEKSSFPLFGIAKGSLSREGGMHRLFGQTVRFSFLDLPKTKYEDTYRLKMNATVLFPITESVFVDADDPLVVEYGRDSPNCGTCKTKFASGGASASASDVALLSQECEVQFISSDVIDVEQPSFASRQHVVVYHITASLDFSDSHHDGLELDIHYWSTLHIRYPSPVGNQQGVADIVIQQPMLYAAVADLRCLTADCPLERNYILQTDAAASEYKRDKWDIPQPIIISVAAGINADFWWVTLMTMSAAMIGGIVVVRNIDSVSDWW